MTDLELMEAVERVLGEFVPSELERVPAERLNGVAITPTERHWLVERGIPNRYLISSWYADETPLAGHAISPGFAVLGTVDRPFTNDQVEDFVCLRVGLPGVWCAPRDTVTPVYLLNSSIAQAILSLGFYREEEDPNLIGFEARLAQLDPVAQRAGAFWREHIDEERSLQHTDDLRLGVIRAFVPPRESWAFRYDISALQDLDDDDVTETANSEARARQIAVAQKLPVSHAWSDLYLHDAAWTRAHWDPVRGLLRLTFYTCQNELDPYEVVVTEFTGCTFEASELEYLRQLFEYYACPTVLREELDFVGTGEYVWRLRLWLPSNRGIGDPVFVVVFRSATLSRSASDADTYDAAHQARPVLTVATG